MKTKEHMIAVVEPTRDGESTIDLAQEVVDRGGRATVLVVMTRRTTGDSLAFAEAEDLRIPDAREIYFERLAQAYSSRFEGHEVATIVIDRPDPSRVAFDTADKIAATSVAIPQRLANRRRWRASVARAHLPVLIAPAAAA